MTKNETTDFASRAKKTKCKPDVAKSDSLIALDRTLEPNIPFGEPDRSKGAGRYRLADESNESDSGTTKEKHEPGNVGETLEPTLEPRMPPGKPGRPKGSSNYPWPPTWDAILEDLVNKLGPCKAKVIMLSKIKEAYDCRYHKRSPNGLRKMIERHMTRLGFATGEPRKKPTSRTAKPWTADQTEALIRSAGEDLQDSTIEKRTGHSMSAVRAKLRRLGYTMAEFRGGTYSIKELATMLNVSEDLVRFWRKKGWFKPARPLTAWELEQQKQQAERKKALDEPDPIKTMRSATSHDLAAFIKDHSEQLPPYHRVNPVYKLELLSYGYPAPEAAQFRANVNATLDSIAGRKKRKDARPDIGDQESLRRKSVRGWIPPAAASPGLAFAHGA